MGLFIRNFLLISLLNIWICICSAALADVIVSTSHGALRGFQLEFNDDSVNSTDLNLNNNGGNGIENKRAVVNVFLGVPFAQPPLGQLRFEVSKFLFKPKNKCNIIIFLFIGNYFLKIISDRNL